MDARVSELIKQNPSLIYLPEQQRVKCIYTNHEMPLVYDVIIHYLSCKKYDLASVNHMLENHKEYIKDVSSDPKHKNKLFCQLTCRYFNKTSNQFLTHIDGRRFKKALLKYNKCKETGEEFIPNTSKYKRGKFSKNINEDSSSTDFEEENDVGISIEEPSQPATKKRRS